jgi:homogentisate 1,2-dioxygenase
MSPIATIAAPAAEQQASAAAPLLYATGFGNEHASEAMAGALPQGRNAPQRPPLGLYAEQITGTAFTAPRAENRRSWVYRIWPPSAHGAFERIADRHIASAPLAGSGLTPNRYRWRPWPLPEAPTDFIDGLFTIAANGHAEERGGIAVHAYALNRAMARRAFANFDGEMLIAPQLGRLLVTTELGRLDVAPGEIALIPRGMKCRVDGADGPSRGFVCENYGAHFRLPELGPIGANGLANARDFQVPVAAFEDSGDSVELVVKCGGLWATTLPHSPFDVVAWHGSYVPCKYDLLRFNAMNSVSYDHPDPSIFTVLTAPSGLPGIANVDFVIFPPRWNVAEDTFRPPFFHRNVMSEFVASIKGRPEARAGDYSAGMCHIHNPFAAHGPDPGVVERASAAELAPRREEGLAIMFETRLPLRVSGAALSSPNLQADYDRNWDALRRHFPG